MRCTETSSDLEENSGEMNHEVGNILMNEEHNLETKGSFWFKMGVMKRSDNNWRRR
jgi:hypothetical protein